MTVIEFQQVSKSYDGQNEVLKGLSLRIEQGEFVTLLGESGCGKTTLLKIINGMIPFDTGFLWIKGRKLSDWDIVELRRQMGYVIQHIGLFPHMTVEENIVYVLTLQKHPQEEKHLRALALLDLVSLPRDFLNRYPRELSGGQKQRVGVARALAANPQIILMDEPFGAVDERTRNQLQEEMRNIHRQLDATILFVTHDLHEALRLGTRVVLMNRGVIEQTGTPEDLALRPTNEYVRNFLGGKGYFSLLEPGKIEAIYRESLGNH